MGKKISFSGIALALSLICLYAAAYLPTGRIVMLALASIFVAVSCEQCGARYGILVFVGTVILSLLFIHKRLFVVIYILFAGLYPLVKLFIEKLRKLWAEWILKILYFNAMLAVFYVFFQEVFLPYLTPAYMVIAMKYMGLILLALEAFFVLYDIALSYMISYYHQFLRRVYHE